jgi:transposase
MELTDKQWEVIEPILPKSKSKPGKRGRPPVNKRGVFNGILWILRTGAQWREMPNRYPSYQTCHRYFQRWSQSGIIFKLLRKLANDLIERGELDVDEGFIDGTFSAAKKGVLELVRQSAAKGARSWQSQTALVFLSPYALQVLHRTK